jgi:hypothetical protein
LTDEDAEEELDDLEEDEVESEPKKVKKPRKSVFKLYKGWVGGLPRAQRVAVIAVTIVLIIFGLVYLSAVIAYEPWYTNDFQKDIDKESQWIEVAAQPFEFSSYVDEGQTWTQGFDFPTDGDKGKYVAEFTIYLIWIDDARTGWDTFQYRVLNSDGDQEASGSGNSGQSMGTARLNNTNQNHVENYRGWSVEVTCLTAQDGVIGPGGIIKIPDDGNDFTVRFEWSYFIEHNPEWE